MRALRSLGRRRWTLAGAAIFLVLTTLFGQASAASADPSSTAKAGAAATPLGGEPEPWSPQNLGARFCGIGGLGNFTPIGLAKLVAKQTGLCKNIQTKGDDWVYCNGTSLLAMVDPKIGIGGDPQNADGSVDKGDLALNALTPGIAKFWIDQMNGNWYNLPKQQLYDSGLGWYYDEAKNEAIDRGNCALLEHLPDPSCAVIRKMPRAERLRHVRGGLLPDECVGTFPTANYNISYDGGGALSFDRNIWGWSTGLLFNINKGAVQVATWSVGQAFGMNLADYTELSTGLSQRYQTQIVGPWGLDDFAWLFLMGYVFITALRGKLGMAGGEFLMAVVMIGLAQILLTNQSDYMNSASRVINLTSSALFKVANGDEALDPGEDPAEGDNTDAMWEEALLPLKQNIHVQFVERPWEYLNYGTLIENLSGECKARAERIAAVGATGDDGWSWRYLAAASSGTGPEATQCASIVRYNRMPTATRFWGAMLTMIIGVIVAVTLTMLSMTVLISKFTIGILFAIAPFALALAAMPGTTRRGALLWATSTVQCTAAAIGSGGVLSIGLMGIDYVLVTTSNDGQTSLFERWWIVLVLVFAIGIGRKKLLSSTQSLAGKMADSMVRMSPAGAGWQGGGGGVDLLSADRGVATAARSARTVAIHAGYVAGAGAVMAQRTVHARSVERRNAKRSLRNLEIMAQRQEQPKLEISRKWDPEAKGPKGTKGAWKTTVGTYQLIRAPRVVDAPGETRGHMKMWGKRDLDADQRRRARGVANEHGMQVNQMNGNLRNPHPGRPRPPRNGGTPPRRRVPRRFRRRL